MAVKIDRLIRSKRKTTAIIVEVDGTVTVRAPKRARRADIEAFVAAKEAWIRKKQALAREQFPMVAPKQYVEEELFFYLGVQYPLMLVARQRPALTLLEGKFCLAQAAQPRGRETFERWYRAQARAVVGERAAHYAAQFGFTFKKLRINGARTRWGSCSSSGALNFTYRLVMAPLDVIDYVVIHELVHFEHPNHSQTFWGRVAALWPEYKEQKAWLDQNGRMLTLDGMETRKRGHR